MGPEFWEASEDLCRRVGVEPNRAFEVTYHHTVGDNPRMTVKAFIRDGGSFVIKNDEPAVETLEFWMDWSGDWWPAWPKGEEPS